MYDERVPVQNIREVMAEVFDVDEADIPEDASPENFPKWTSLEHLTLLVALEARFGTAFSINEMASMTSLPQIVAVLSQYKVARVS